jgi:two-component system phosphate regulon sensor histidine kinase PhoR
VRNRIFFKLLLAFLPVIVVTAFTLDTAIRRAWEGTLRDEIHRSLEQKARLFANRVENEHTRSLPDVTAQEASTMENHAHRPEFEAALAGRMGVDERPSKTLGIPFIYAAAPISGGAVRFAYPLTDLAESSKRVHRALLLGSGIALVVTLLLAAIAAHLTSKRLHRIVDFADRVAAGDLTARIASGSGDEIGQVASALDKTARTLESSFVALQTSQRQLETLLNSMQDAVIAVDAEGRVQWANHGMDRLVPQRTRLNAPVVETIRDPQFLAAVRVAIDAHKVSSARANSILPNRSFDVTAAPMPGGGAVAVLRDLTETERVEKTRRDFIANVSHELRTPLTSIQGYTETLLDTSTENGHVREFLEIVRKNAARMSRLTEDLLTLARVESGETRFAFQPAAPSDLLEDALESFREIARGYGIDLVVESVTHTPVDADREAIHQVFSNLIDNALKYGGTGGKVAFGARDTEKGVEFYVRDFGPGIPSEHLPRLFERFYRVDKARSRESGGTGLGLAIAKHIVLAHGGAIRAESELNHGSAFLFTLRRAPVTV